MAIAIKNRAARLERQGTAASGAAIGAGAVAGLVGGVLMAVAAMIRAAAAGPGFFAPMKLIAASFYGPDAVQGGAGPVIVGLLTHLVIAAVLGLVFGLVVGRKWSMGGALGLGLVWGFIVWAVMTWIVLPVVDQTMLDAVTDIAWWWFGYHMLFGATLFLTPPLAAAYSGRPMRPAASNGQGRMPPRA